MLARVTHGPNLTLGTDGEGAPAVSIPSSTTLTYSNSRTSLKFRWTDAFTINFRTRFVIDPTTTSAQGYLATADITDIRGMSVVAFRSEDPDLLLGLLMTETIDIGMFGVVNVNKFVDENWHSVRISYNPSGYTRGGVINSDGSIKMWVDGVLLPNIERSNGTYGAPEAIVGMAPVRLGIYSLASDKGDVPEEISYLTTRLADLIVCEEDSSKTSDESLAPEDLIVPLDQLTQPKEKPRIKFLF